MGTLANSENPAEMLHAAAFHQGLHCLLKQNRSSEKATHFFLKFIICDPSIYIMDHPDLTVCSFMENSIGLKRVKFYKDYKLFRKAKTCFYIYF